jgi:hypothetical protein
LHGGAKQNNKLAVKFKSPLERSVEARKRKRAPTYYCKCKEESGQGNLKKKIQTNGTCSYRREAEIWGGKKRKKKEKSVFEQLDTLELAANGPREHK